jgi:hypothetical protein
MLKTFAGALVIAGAMLAVPSAVQAAPCVDRVAAATTQELSAQTVVKKKVVVKKKGAVRSRTVVRTRTYDPPKYYGYYGPTYYERPYSRPNTVVFGLGGWW